MTRLGFGLRGRRAFGATAAAAFCALAVVLVGFAQSARAEEDACSRVGTDPEAAWAYSVGLQAYVYGYPLVDLAVQMRNETRRISPTQPIAAPVNAFAVYPHRLTPSTQGALRAPNSDTIYFSGWIDLGAGPVVLRLPDAAGRYYTIALTDMFGRPTHVGLRTTGSAARDVVLVREGAPVASGEQRVVVSMRSRYVWALGRMYVADEADEARAIDLARKFRIDAPVPPAGPVTEGPRAERPAGLEWFATLNRALKDVSIQPEERAFITQLDQIGLGPASSFDAARLSTAARAGLVCAAQVGGGVIDKVGWRPTSATNGWMLNSRIGDPGSDYLLRASVARGGYVNAPEEAIYPAAVRDRDGAALTGANTYEIVFPKGQLPPVDAFWSLTPYAAPGFTLTDNPIRRYAIGDRTKGLKFDKDGALRIVLSAANPGRAASNWLPIPPGPFVLVARLYMPRKEALDGRYALPPIALAKSRPAQ